MYEWLQKLSTRLKRLQGQRYLVLSQTGADEDQLATVEAHWGCNLSLSHREFLTHWNSATLHGTHILSTDELLNWDSQAVSEYDQKSDFLRVFATVNNSGEVYAFNTEESSGEYSVVHFEAETFDAQNIKAKFPSFEAMLLHEVYDLLDAEAAYMMDEADEELGEDEFEEYDVFFTNSIEKLNQLLASRGANLQNRLKPDWSNWS